MLRKNLITILIAGLFVIILMGSVYANDNATDNSTTHVKTFTDIQSQIDEADENDTIELEGTYKSTGKEIKITKAVTLTSKDSATLDGQSKSNIFNISNVNVCIKNLNFINSNSKTTSAIYSEGNLTIYNCNFTNNTVYNPDIISSFYLEEIERSAGAIYSTNQLNIIDCEFENNYAEILVMHYEYFEEYLADLGGAIYSNASAVINNSKFKENYIESNSSLIILNSEFITSNIKCYSQTSIVNSSFTKNPDYSPSISTSSNLNISGCNFTNNGGYVIYCENYDEKTCKLIINSSNFINNNLICADEYDYSADREMLNEEYNTIFSECSDIYVYNSNFENNTATAITNNWGNLFVQNSTFSKNSGYKGGAMNSYNTTVINSTFKNNQAEFAGAIYAKIIVLDNCSFTDNNEGAVGVEESALINNNSYSGLNYFNNSLNKIQLITASTSKLTTAYNSGKTVWIKMIYAETGHPLINEPIDLKIVNGKKVYYKIINTNLKGIGYFKASSLAAGTYKITFSYDDLVKISTTVKITKAKTVIKAPKVTAKYKKSKYFKVAVKNKASKKAVKNTYVKVKIDKKTYKIKTDSKGVAKFNTKKLKIGKHKVTISSGNTNYIMSGKSTITIKK